jgi:hypothetical protein
MKSWLDLGWPGAPSIEIELSALARLPNGPGEMATLRAEPRGPRSLLVFGSWVKEGMRVE